MEVCRGFRNYCCAPLKQLIFILLLNTALSVKGASDSTNSFLFLNSRFVTSSSYKPIVNEGRVTDMATAFIRHISTRTPEEYLLRLENFKKDHNLNDWLYFKLVKQLSLHIASGDNNLAALHSWYFMARSGYDVRLVICNNSHIQVYSYTRDTVYDEDYFIMNGKSYARLPINNMRGESVQYTLCNYLISNAVRPLQFSDIKQPVYTPGLTENRTLFFNHDSSTSSYDITVDKEILKLYSDHPNTGLTYTFSVPLSPVAYKSLMPQLKKDLEGLSRYQGIEFLLSFTREAFFYEDDREKGKGVERYLTPEQTLIEKSSDCEDRAALFYYLVKDIYNMPMVVVSYPTHVSVAVDFENTSYGSPIIFEGRRYSICEPTGPGNELKIGEFPDFVDKDKYNIVLQHIPSSGR